jgi:hypothetical protein
MRRKNINGARNEKGNSFSQFQISKDPPPSPPHAHTHTHTHTHTHIKSARRKGNKRLGKTNGTIYYID